MNVQLTASRRGFQLVELLVSLTSASILMLGVVFSIYVTSRSRDIVSERSGNTFLSHQGSERLLFDLSAATEIVSHTDTDIRFKVDAGDGYDKTVRYAWDGIGNPLLYSDSGKRWLKLSEPLSSFKLTLADTEPQAVADLDSFDPAGQFVFESAIYDSIENSDRISLPGTYTTGDLLLAVVAVEDVSPGTISELTGWTKVFEAENSKLTLAVFYTFSPSHQYAQIEWEWADEALCALSHFRVNSPSTALISHSTVTGKSAEPYVAETTTTSDRSLVLRLLSTAHKTVDSETTNLPGHLPVLFRSAEGGTVLGNRLSNSRTSRNSIQLEFSRRIIERLHHSHDGVCTMSRQQYPRSGLSLIETVVSTALVTILMVTAMSTVAQVNRITSAESYQHAATRYAQYYLSEIASKPFVCPDCGSEAIGRGFGEGSLRAFWNDCDDYHNLYLSSLTDEQGEQIPGATGWRMHVNIRFSNPANPLTAVSNRTDLKRIRLKFWAPNDEEFFFYGLRSRYGPQQAPLASNYFSGADVLMESGTSSQLLRSRLINHLEKQ